MSDLEAGSSGDPAAPELPTDIVVAQREIAQLRRALESRSVIDQAKGIVRAWLCCDEQSAWHALVAASQHANVKVRDLSAQLVDLASGCDDRSQEWLADHVGPAGSANAESAVV